MKTTLILMILFIAVGSLLAETLIHTYRFEMPEMVTKENYTEILYENCYNMGEEGNPLLPYFSTNILLPQEQEIINIRILNEEYFSDILYQLKEYFAGRLQNFKVKMHLEGTDFQLRVWQELQQIPYGKTASYGQIAKQIGNPKACRAVGGANNKNPIPIIIPCHRIIGNDGSLTGFGGGLELKKDLLRLEKVPGLS